MITIFNKKSNLVLFILIISTISLAAAYVAEYVFNIKPCVLCVYERIPYMLAIGVALSSLFNKKYSYAINVFIAIFLISSILSIYHVGVEQHIFAGTSECNNTAKNINNIEDLRAKILGDNHASCSEIALSFLSISFAGWNAILSMLLTYICVKNRK
jgi:disulfide bond formation protein DsbB